MPIRRILVVLAALLLAPSIARAEVSASGNTTAPVAGQCAHGAVTMGRFGDHIAIMGYTALWGSVGNAVCNTWASGPPRQLSVSFTLWRQVPGLGTSTCKGNPAYPGWQTAIIDVLDLHIPGTDERVIEHAGCGPGLYRVELKTSFKDVQGVWHHGALFTPWELYLLPF
jgi:hypothetical protein